MFDAQPTLREITTLVGLYSHLCFIITPRQYVRHVTGCSLDDLAFQSAVIATPSH